MRLSTLRSRDSAVGSGDLITDLGTGDKIDLHLIDADVTTAGDRHFISAPPPATPATWWRPMTYHAPEDRTVIQLYVDGDAIADAEITLAGDPLVSAGDFIL